MGPALALLGEGGGGGLHHKNNSVGCVMSGNIPAQMDLSRPGGGGGGQQIRTALGHHPSHDVHRGALRGATVHRGGGVHPSDHLSWLTTAIGHLPALMTLVPSLTSGPPCSPHV